MKLSFIIPAYNEEKYLGKCLESILREENEKNHETEIIVVNNASTDGTRKVAEAFRGVNIVDEPRKGLVQARQSGFMASNGDLIANVDADTILTPGWIEKVFDEFLKDEKLVALSGPFVYYDLSDMGNFWVKLFFYFGFAGNLIGQKIFKRGSILQGGNFVLRRTALEKIGGYNLKLQFYGEDTDMAMRISKVGDIKFTLNLPMYSSARRLKKNGIFMTGLRSICDYLWIMMFKRPFQKTARDTR